MHLIVLCGGNGTRLNDYSFPKPLNMINGKPSITYCLANLPAEVDTIHFITAPHLRRYNFEEIVINQFKDKKCIVHWLPYYTRGPIESAWLGTLDIEDDGRPIVFLDNDVIYHFPDKFFTACRDSAFLGYSLDKKATEAYSFIMIQDDKVVNIKEKRRISDFFCCGVYGFRNIMQFRQAATHLLHSQFDRELYMSLLFQYFIEQSTPVDAIHFPMEIVHIGTLPELRSCWPKEPKMRICFDLDNTLVSYPRVPGDYTTVRPIAEMIDMARTLHEDGHTIIIHTARRMTTHRHNVGAVLKDIGAITFKTLEEFGIPFDEIIFGKPIADLYIDDRAVNPYRDAVSVMGVQYEEVERPINMMPANKYNTLTVVQNTIIKRGPTQFLSGEIHFYENIPKNTSLATYFPQYYSCNKSDTISELTIEYIKGIPFYTLLKYKLITETHINQLLEFVDILHGMPATLPSKTTVMRNYVDKLVERFKVVDDYPFDNATEVQERCLQFFDNYEPRISAFIHGDLWFSNIIVNFSNKIKCIDMKGQIAGELTTGGDIMYDYGKLYQSLLGFDAALYGDTLDVDYLAGLRQYYVSVLERRKGISEPSLRGITTSLIIGTMHAIEGADKKLRIWNLIQNIMSAE